jgi:hypothetical protein
MKNKFFGVLKIFITAKSIVQTNSQEQALFHAQSSARVEPVYILRNVFSGEFTTKDV